MFTGIIESLGTVVSLEHDQGNVHIGIESNISKDLKVDQSIAHNGVCLTVVKNNNDQHVVTAIDETILKTNLGKLELGSRMNLERCLKIGDRIDGHMVQGHVDEVATCLKVTEDQGSWRYKFKGEENVRKLIVNKGSICINGVSLTVVEVRDLIFEVAIIPFTYKHTTFSDLKTGDKVNIEYDIIGKYILKNYQQQL
jgi:riboflavin synthase